MEKDEKEVKENKNVAKVEKTEENKKIEQKVVEEKTTKAEPKKEETKKTEDKKQNSKVAEKVGENKEGFKKVSTSSSTNIKETTSNKANTVKTTKSKKNKKSTKPYLVSAVILILLIVAIVIGAIVLPNTPKKSIEGMLTGLKTGDFETANLYIDNNNLTETINFASQNNGEVENEIERLCFEKMTWKINNIKEEQDKATAELEISNKDFKTIMANYMQTVLKNAFSGQSMTEEQYNNYLLEELKSDEIQTVTNTATFELTKQDGKWVVNTSDEVVNTLLPGLQSAVNSLESIGK